ncbi:hypothetical protein [Borreliella garinii]|uniref:hypothetical protein n=2 Tax=Borreliella garinii TaxID=29519 RepID=UPI001AEFF097|nr:hypothetical protein [Borreliella garinii]
MNKKIRMFIVCSVFALIISCKNYASSKDLKQGLKEQVKEFLDIKKEELTEGIKSLGSEVSAKVRELMQADESQGQPQEQVVQGVNENSELKEEIAKKIKELKDKMGKSDKKTSLKKYSEYEEEIKKIKKELEKKLKDKKEDKEKLEKELETSEKTLKEKIEERTKELELAQKEFEKLKEKVNNASGQTYGDIARNQGSVGAQAWSNAEELGLNVSYSSSDSTDSNELAKKVIADALKKIEEELKNTGKNVVEIKKE